MKLKQRLMSSGLVLAAVAVIGTSQIAAAKINDAGLELLGISEAEYEVARDEAVTAYNNELAAMGWISAEEAAEANEEGHWARLGRGQYYNVLDKDVFIADSLGVSLAEWEAAEDASYEAKIAEKIENGRLTAAEAADKQAIHEFKESIDKDSIMAQSLGISVAELNAARTNNVTFSDLLDELAMTREEVKEAQQVVTTQLVEGAVADGSLTADQAEQLLNDRDGHGHGRRHGGGRSPGNSDPEPPPPDNA
ncbi:MAG: hypothetical protein R3293_10855 [Candidatus Promineifilaceae bacterium]|nr:hypothetical protein [Candidatus Promineifilaceae bacterium]